MSVNQSQNRILNPALMGEYLQIREGNFELTDHVISLIPYMDSSLQKYLVSKVMLADQSQNRNQNPAV